MQVRWRRQLSFLSLGFAEKFLQMLECALAGRSIRLSLFDGFFDLEYGFLETGAFTTCCMSVELVIVVIVAYFFTPFCLPM
jgi:hypothetical protein